VSDKAHWQDKRKTIFFEEELNILCGNLCIYFVKELGISVSTLNMTVKKCHVIEENENQCGQSEIQKNTSTARYQIIF
jgi:hypothetical protein